MNCNWVNNDDDEGDDGDDDDDHDDHDDHVDIKSDDHEEDGVKLNPNHAA